MRNSAKPAVAFCGAILATALAVSMAGPANAAEGKPVPSDPRPFSYLSKQTRARMAAQEPLKQAASQIQWSAAKGDSTGYAGIGLGTGEVVVWWKGALPKTVEQTVAKVRRVAAVRVEPAAYSRSELESAARGIEDYLRRNPDSPYHGVEIAYDGSGLVVNTDSAFVGPQGSATALPTEMAIPRGVPVTVSQKQRPQLAGRLDDYAPFWGAGRIQNNSNGSFCTAGFAVVSGGARYMLTAGHCGHPGGTWNNGNDTRFFGTATHEHISHDLLLISASTAGRIFDGGVGSGEFTKGVAGWDWVWAGEWLCTSGSVTGALCNHVVSNTFAFAFCGYDAYGYYECYNDLILSYQYNGLTASRPGDSGGPVFGLSGSANVIAKGTITGYIGSNGLIFQDFGQAYLDFGVTPVIG